MIRSILPVAALLLVAVVAEAQEFPTPKTPFSVLLAQNNVPNVVRPGHVEEKRFNGTFKGEFDSFGSLGTYSGSFRGKETGRLLDSTFEGIMQGTQDMFGSKGTYTASFGGKYSEVELGGIVTGRMNGDFKFAYDGMYGGKEHTGTVVGSFRGDFGPKGYLLQEKGNFNGRWLGANITGSYKSFFDGTEAGVSMRGTVDGEKFTFAYKLMYEGLERLFKTSGSYIVTVNGMTKTGTFNTTQLMSVK